MKNINKKTKIIVISAICLLLIILLPIIWYNTSLGSISKEDKAIEVDIETGSSTNTIAKTLKSAGAIKSDLAFRIYVKLNKIEGFKAGIYEFNTNMNVKQVTELLLSGKSKNNQTSITFIEGKNIKWIAEKIASETTNSADDVYSLLKDSSYIDGLINDYWFLTNEIKNKDIYYPLEGYLFPDTYFFSSNKVSVKEIFKAMLDKMVTVLSEYKQNIQSKNLSVHEILSMASIVELEGVNPNQRKDIASVFYNRMDANMSLGSDVTTYYAFKINVGDRDLTVSELNTYNGYNTRGPNMNGKLPIGPIACCSSSSIEAAINPNTTSYLYFVADKNGELHFAKTYAEHEKIVQNLQDNNLWYEY